MNRFATGQDIGMREKESRMIPKFLASTTIYRYIEMIKRGKDLERESKILI